MISIMMTSSNENIFRVTGPLCGEFTGHDEFLAQRPLTRSFDVFIDLCLNKQLSKQSWGWWFETPSRSLRHHCNVMTMMVMVMVMIFKDMVGTMILMKFLFHSQISILIFSIWLLLQNRHDISRVYINSRSCPRLGIAELSGPTWIICSTDTKT